MAQEIKFDQSCNGSKTYATRKAMEQQINKVSWTKNARYLVLQTEEGRFYPVFLMNSLPDGCGAIWCAQHGWCVVG